MDGTRQDELVSHPLKANLLTFVLICFAVSVTYTAVFSSDALILPVSPVSAGKKRLSISAGLCPLMRGAMSRVIRKYGSWSIAHGMRHRSRLPAPNKWGNESGKDGAAWMAGKPIWPILDSFVNPKMPRAWLYVTH